MTPSLIALIFIAGITKVADVRCDDEELLRCYHCGTGNAEDVKCDFFQQLPRWAPFEVTCSPDTYCLKSINQGNVVRGCSSKRDFSGKLHRPGCHKASDSHQSGATICLCDTKLCNSASTPERTSLVFKLLIFIYVKYQIIGYSLR